MNEITHENKAETLFSERVYYVESEKDETVLVAMNIRINGNLISWFDGTKERIMRIGKILQNDNADFSFENDDDEKSIYKFKKLTLSTYNEKVKNKVYIPTEYNDEETMLSDFESTIRSAW